MGKEQSDSDRNRDKMPKLLFSCCKSKEARYCVCVNCGAIFHKSCIERAKNITVVDASRVICCSANLDDSSIVKHLYNEISLMRNLLDEKEKTNVLLEEKVRHLECGVNEHGSMASRDMSYAKVVSKVPPILVKPNSKTSKGDIIKKIKKEVKIRDLNISVDTVRETRNGSVLIKCNNHTNNETMESEIKKIANLNCEVKTLSMKKPRVKIADIIEDFDPDDIADEIIAQNFDSCEKEDVKVIYVQTNRKKNTHNIILELAQKLFHSTMRSETLYVGWQRCRIYEHFNLSRCYKCCGYGHSAKKCVNAVRCQYCAGNHDGLACPDKDNRLCANCLSANEKYKTEKNTAHYAFEENQCESYQYLKRRVINQTDYS